MFPSNAEYTKLHDLCVALASLLGKRIFEFGQYFSTIKRIENRYSKLGIVSFFDGILVKFERLEVPPRTAIYNALQDGRMDEAKRRVLQDVYDMLGSEEWRPSFEFHPWGDWLDVVQGLNPGICYEFCGDGRAFKGEQSLFAEARRSHKGVFAYLMFMDLIRQQNLWMRRFAKTTKPTIAWIYSLQRPGDLERLRHVVHGDTANTEKLRVYAAKDKNRQRRKRHYWKHRFPKPVQ
jgi:hypothetical protein